MLRLYSYFRQLLNVFVANAFPPIACRFAPTCSVYCATALSKYGVIIGSCKCLWRLLRCHPFSHGGYDPI